MANNLTKKEKYLLRKRQKEQERLQAARRKKIRKTLKISLPLFLIIGGIVLGSIYYLSGEKKESPSGSIPKIEIVEPEYDAGTVSMADGNIQHTYEIKNMGDGDLKISRIWTSCMCTTARLKVGDKESPEFGMHSNPVFWSQKIAPGETGYLEVSFDQAFHGPQGTGSVVRVVYLSTNDPQNEKAEIRLLANVVQ